MLSIITDPEDAVGNPHYVGNAELAVRLGSLSRYDRLGDVLSYENFSDGISKGEAETDGTGAAVEWVANRAATGGFACKVTAGSDDSRYAGIKFRVPAPFSVVHGVEMAWTLHADMDYGIIQAGIYTGAYKISFGIKLDTTTLHNYYLNSVGGWSIVQPIAAALYNDRYFVCSKLTFDASTQKYSRLISPPGSYDIAGHGCLIIPDAVTRPHMSIWGRIYSDAGKNAYSYIDNMILTTNDV